MSTSTFLVTLRRAGPDWVDGAPAEDQRQWTEHADYMDELVRGGHLLLGGPLNDGITVVLAVAAASEAEVRVLLDRDPWSGSHLVIETIEPWTVRLRAPGLSR